MTQTLTTRLKSLENSHAFQPKSNPRHSIVPHPTPASFASASSYLDLSNFNTPPSKTLTDTKTNSTATALFKNNNAFANSDANAAFIGGNNTPIADTSASLDTFNIATGSGKRYDANASSKAIVKGLDFYVAPKATFTFDFTGAMAFDTQSNSRRSNAVAQGKTSFIVYATNDQGTQAPIDRLLISGTQSSRGTQLNLNVSNGFTLNLQTKQLSLASNELSFNGTYSRTFDTATKLTVVATQKTSAKAGRWGR